MSRRVESVEKGPEGNRAWPDRWPKWRARSRKRLERWLILPRPVYVGAGLLVTASILFGVAAALLTPTKYFGMAPQEIDAICDKPPEIYEPRETASGCVLQLVKRKRSFDTKLGDLDVACKRRSGLVAELGGASPNVRQDLREEETEIARVYGLLRELAGPERPAEPLHNVGLVAITALSGLGALLLGGKHARSVGVRRLGDGANGWPSFGRQFGRWLFRSAGLTLAVAIGVTFSESMDSQKTGYDWASYCLSGSTSVPWTQFTIAGPSFWLQHATLVPVSILVGLQVATGWYVTHVAFIPVPRAERPGWGIGPYVTFLEVWFFAIVAIAGALTAIWIRGMVASRTNRESFFLGFGTLPFVFWLEWRFWRNARALRNFCERVRRGAVAQDKLPPPPAGGLIAENWWQVPALFGSAWGIVAALLEWGGLGKLFELGK